MQMGWFSRKNKEVIDLTKLRDSGVLQRSQEIARQNQSLNSNSKDVVDLSSFGSSGNSGNDFLDSLASVGIASNASESVVDKLKAARHSNIGAVNELKNKIEDIEYKLERFIERLKKIEEKLGA